MYTEDGTYTYPKNSEDLLRNNGEEYFSGVEFTGAREGKEKDPKMSLLNVYQDTIVLALGEKVMENYNDGGKRQVVIVEKENGASLHQDKTYVREIKNIE